MTPLSTTASSIMAHAKRNHLCFLVGQDKTGKWLVLEEHGLGGGIFVSKDAALHYAEAECAHAPGGVRIADERIDLRI